MSDMQRSKTVFTTGDVAKICNVAPRTVSKWFDSGHLRGYRIPGSKDRRIPIEHLVRFMRAHGIPLNGLESGAFRVLVFDADDALCRVIRDALVAHEGYEVAIACTPLEAGAVAQEFKPNVMIVDVRSAQEQPKAIFRFVRSLDVSHPVLLIGVGQGLSSGEGEALLQAGFDGYLSKPFDVQSVMSLIDEKTGMTVGGAAV